MGKEVEEESVNTLREFLEKTQRVSDPLRSVTNTLTGIEIEKNPILPTNTEGVGLLFVTRPMLNLRNEELIKDRKLSKLIGDFTVPSIYSYVKGTLDPITLYKHHKKLNDNLLVDPQNPFIPAMTNLVKSVSGWEDIVLPTKTVGGGTRKEEFIYADGIVDHYRKFSLDITFENIISQPIMELIDTWTRYISLKFAGVVKKHHALIIQDRVSYHSRIYRFTLSKDKRYVINYGCTGYSFPVNVPIGKKLDMPNKDDMYNGINRETNVRFESVGIYYNDPIVIRMFNQTVSSTHSGMRAVNNGESGHDMILVPRNLLHRLSGLCYPRINILTRELEWWTDKEKLEKVKEEESEK